VNKARLIEKIAERVREKTIEGISDLRDESDRDGMRIVIDLKRGEVPDVVLNNLYKHTALQSTFGIIMLAIVGGRPRVLSLVEMIDHFIDFRRDVVRRRTEFDLRKASGRRATPRRRGTAWWPPSACRSSRRRPSSTCSCSGSRASSGRRSRTSWPRCSRRSSGCGPSSRATAC
jgi:hypothetical protein